MIDSLLSNTKKNWDTKSIPDLKGKTALVTGSNSGLGYYTAKALAENNCHVILSCRTSEKSIATKNKLKKLIPQAQLSTIEIELSDFNDVSCKCDQISDHIE